MKVMKFGGTSVGSAQRMKNVVALVKAAGNVTVVLSAMSGTTNSLISLTQSIKDAENANATKQIDDLEKKYHDTARELISDPALLEEASARLDVYFNELRNISHSRSQRRRRRRSWLSARSFPRCLCRSI